MMDALQNRPAGAPDAEAPSQTGRQIGSILVRQGMVTDQQLAQAMARQNGNARPLGDVLVEMGIVSPEGLARALAAQLNIPFFELGEEFKLSREEVALIPEAIARRFCLVPVRRGSAPVVTVVMKDPIDVDAIDTVRSLTQMEVHKAISTEVRIVEAINRFYRDDAHIEQNLRDIVDLETAAPELGADGARMDADQLRVLANDAPVVRFVNLLLMSAVRDRASDIHFEPGEQDVSIRIRVDGYLREVTPPPRSLYPAIVTRLKILSNMDIGERRLPLDGRFKFKVGSRVVDVRVSSLPEVFGEKLVLRLLDRAGMVEDMSAIGFEPETVARFKRVLGYPEGIILLTGPTGSGKTTTLYCALSYLRDPTTNIQTVEDPVEYLIPGINQMQVREKIGLDFAGALRAILRQDPDIIMVGEIRDTETARMAMRASLTGHLVLSTLHTNDAVSAVSRLRDIGVENYLISATVHLVISQRLVRRLCEHCKQPVPADGDHLEMIRPVAPDAAGWTFHGAKGCDHCAHTGYRGRVAVVEFLEVTDPIRRLIAERAGELEIKAKAYELGMRPLIIDGLEKVKRGITTLEEIASVWPLNDLSEEN
jgi:type IV pilus assembly protein PilB